MQQLLGHSNLNIVKKEPLDKKVKDSKLQQPVNAKAREPSTVRFFPSCERERRTRIRV
ncbi:MAG TPA: hypothetical protein VEG44_04200 [Candidatus Acidoferrales bacterium]|nr:hypothetical protein [Candidatus Acidoferrales bacterium]